MTIATFARRMLGAALLRRRTYEDVEADPRATPYAVAVALATSVSAGIGWVGLEREQLPAALLLAVVAMVGFVTWAVLSYRIGTRWFRTRQTRADVPQLVRTLGFAAAPGVLFGPASALGAGPTATAVIAVWMLAAMIVAVRQALDYDSTLRALAVCLTGWLVALGMFWIIAVLFATPVA